MFGGEKWRKGRISIILSIETHKAVFDKKRKEEKEGKVKLSPYQFFHSEK